jgi:hypothetical protein
MHQHPTSHTDNHQQGSENSKGDVPYERKTKTGYKTPNPQKLMLVH